MTVPVLDFGPFEAPTDAHTTTAMDRGDGQSRTLRHRFSGLIPSAFSSTPVRPNTAAAAPPQLVPHFLGDSDFLARSRADPPLSSSSRFVDQPVAFSSDDLVMGYPVDSDDPLAQVEEEDEQDEEDDNIAIAADLYSVNGLAHRSSLGAALLDADRSPLPQTTHAGSLAESLNTPMPVSTNAITTVSAPSPSLLGVYSSRWTQQGSSRDMGSDSPATL